MKKVAWNIEVVLWELWLLLALEFKVFVFI